MKQSLLSIWKGVFEGSVWRNWCESYAVSYTHLTLPTIILV